MARVSSDSSGPWISTGVSDIAARMRARLVTLFEGGAAIAPRTACAGGIAM